jgi:predicted phage baseplate assembly protein
VEVEEADGWRAWTEVDTLAASGPLDRHYTVDLTAGLVQFGARARVPQIGQRIRVVSYRYGGGVAGNLPAGSVTALTGQANVKVTNVLPATGGADAADLSEALEEIPARVHRRDRAVAEDDFRALALEVPGVKRAETMELFHPDTLNQRAAGVVSVMVFPEEDLLHPGAPTPDVALLRRVAAYLNPRRLVTTELYVIPPTYRSIAVSVGVRVRDGYQADAVRHWVELILRQYLAPLPPYGPDGAGWPRGRLVHRAELEAVAVQVDGVERLEDELRLAQRVAPNTPWVPVQREVVLQPWEVPELASTTVVAGSPLEAGAGYPPPGPAQDGPVLVPLPPDVR